MIPSRNFANHAYIIPRTIIRRVDSNGQLLRRVRCSKKVQSAAHRADLPNPKWQLA